MTNCGFQLETRAGLLAIGGMSYAELPGSWEIGGKALRFGRLELDGKVAVVTPNDPEELYELAQIWGLEGPAGP